MKIKGYRFVLASIIMSSCVWLSQAARAAEYPPAMNYDNFTEFIRLGTQDSKLSFASQLYTMKFYLPGRDAQIRMDIVDQKGQIISTKERVHHYKNGESLGEVDTWVNKCKSGTCLNGPNTPVLQPGLYWLVCSEEGKIFSAEWFEVRTYKLGEGRFAKGQITYAYLPTSQMAQISLDSGELEVQIGVAGESEVGDHSSVNKNMLATLKYNGKLFGKLPGNSPAPLTVMPYTQMFHVNLSKASNNNVIKKADLKDGNYELEIMLDHKAYRKFKFQLKGSKIVPQGRQLESTQPPEHMIVSEKSAWIWNSYAKEPTRNLPQLDLNAALSAQGNS